MKRLIYCKTNQQLIIEPRSSLHALFCYGACLACILLIFRLCMADSGPDRRHLTYIWQTHAAKTSKTHPRSGCFRRRRAIYKRDVSVRKAKSAIHSADRPVEMGVLREVISREYTLRPTAGERCVVLRLSFVLAAERGMSRMVPRWVVLR